MDGVSGVSGGATPRPAQVSTPGAANTGAAQGASTSGQSSAVNSSSSLMSSSTSLSSRISSYISTVGGVLTDEQLLRALVVMLLMEMLNKDEEESKPALLSLGGLQSGGYVFAGVSSYSSYSSISSATNVSQISQQSVTLDSAQAVQSLGDGSGQPAGPQQLDVSG